MRESTKKLLVMVDDFIDKRIDYMTLYGIYCDIQQESLGTDDDEDHFEWKLDDLISYTTDYPEPEDREVGLISSDEFREWLKIFKQKNIHFWEEKDNPTGRSLKLHEDYIDKFVKSENFETLEALKTLFPQKELPLSAQWVIVILFTLLFISVVLLVGLLSA